MPIVAECPYCHTKVRLPDNALGRSVRCPNKQTCGDYFTAVPLAAPPQGRGGAGVPSSGSPPATVPAIPPTPLPPGELPTVTVTGEPVEDLEPPKAQMSEALAAFCLVSLAFFPSGYPYVRLLAIPLALIGLVVGVRAIAASLEKSRPNWLGGLAVLLGVFALAVGFWPTLLYAPAAPARSGPRSGSGPLAAVPRQNDSQQEPSPLDRNTWVDASQQALQWGDLQLRLSVVQVVPAASAGGTDGQALVIVLQAVSGHLGAPIAADDRSNAVNTEKPGVKLTDDRNRSYAQAPDAVRLEAIRVTRGAESFLPGRRPVDEVLVFQAPPADVAFLRLEVPAAPLGGSGTVRLQIPKRLIVWKNPERARRPTVVPGSAPARPPAFGRPPM